jgi:hypothetical protein
MIGIRSEGSSILYTIDIGGRFIRHMWIGVMEYQLKLPSALVALSLIAILSGCGSGEDAPPSVAPSSAITIATPQVSPTFQRTFQPYPETSGVFTSDLTKPLAFESNLARYADAQGNVLLHLNLYRNAGTGPNESNTYSRFLSLSAATGWDFGASGSTDPRRSAFGSANGLVHFSAGRGWSFGDLVQYKQPGSITALFDSDGSDVAIGPAPNNELTAMRLRLEGGQFTLETRKTTGGVWSASEKQTVQMPTDFSTVREINGRILRFRSIELLDVISGTSGDALHVRLSGDLEPAYPFSRFYGGDYLLWRARGSEMLHALERDPICESASPMACVDRLNRDLLET